MEPSEENVYLIVMLELKGLTALLDHSDFFL